MSGRTPRGRCGPPMVGASRAAAGPAGAGDIAEL